MQLTLEISNSDQLSNVCGSFDRHSPILGAFMEISNHSDSDIKLLSANTKGYKRLELHKTVSQDGMMKMIKQDCMPIPAHKTINSILNLMLFFSLLYPYLYW
jgi:hypothetical protein